MKAIIKYFFFFLFIRDDIMIGTQQMNQRRRSIVNSFKWYKIKTLCFCFHNEWELSFCFLTFISSATKDFDRATVVLLVLTEFVRLSRYKSSNQIIFVTGKRWTYDGFALVSLLVVFQMSIDVLDLLLFYAIQPQVKDRS